MAACCLTAAAQNPYTVAGDHYHLAFENEWVRATRVTYQPHDHVPVHEHPPTPTTVYVYVTDDGPIAFHHVTGDRVAGHTFRRPAVQAGAIRFAHGAPETHSVDYLGDEPTEYARIELRTEPVDRPVRDVRLPPGGEFENGQVRILRVHCAAGELCPPSAHPQDPAVVVTMTGSARGLIEWSPPPARGPVDQVRIELKTRPVRAPAPYN